MKTWKIYNNQRHGCDNVITLCYISKLQLAIATLLSHFNHICGLEQMCSGIVSVYPDVTVIVMLLLSVCMELQLDWNSAESDFAREWGDSCPGTRMRQNKESNLLNQWAAKQLRAWWQSETDKRHWSHQRQVKTHWVCPCNNHFICELFHIISSSDYSLCVPSCLCVWAFMNVLPLYENNSFSVKMHCSLVVPSFPCHGLVNAPLEYH